MVGAITTRIDIHIVGFKKPVGIGCLMGLIAELIL
jgi:hypothetical protein